MKALSLFFLLLFFSSASQAVPPPATFGDSACAVILSGKAHEKKQSYFRIPTPEMLLESLESSRSFHDQLSFTGSEFLKGFRMTFEAYLLESLDGYAGKTLTDWLDSAYDEFTTDFFEILKRDFLKKRRDLLGLSFVSQRKLSFSSKFLHTPRFEDYRALFRSQEASLMKLVKMLLDRKAFESSLRHLLERKKVTSHELAEEASRLITRELQELLIESEVAFLMFRDGIERGDPKSLSVNSAVVNISKEDFEAARKDFFSRRKDTVRSMAISEFWEIQLEHLKDSPGSN